jgi:hypothetical protein
VPVSTIAYSSASPDDRAAVFAVAVHRIVPGQGMRIPYRLGLNWTAAIARVMFVGMSAGRQSAPRVTYVTAALGSRLPLARELCCRSHGAIQ